MNAYTPMQTLAKIHRQLWWLIRLTGSVEVQFGPESASFADLCEVEKVMRVMVEEVSKIIRRERDKEPNQRNRRQGEELALKAQLAKARSAVASVLNERDNTQSHK